MLCFLCCLVVLVADLLGFAVGVVWFSLGWIGWLLVWWMIYVWWFCCVD